MNDQPELWRTDPRERLLAAIDRTWAYGTLGATPTDLVDDFARHVATNDDEARRLRLAHQARRAKEHQLDDIRRALCDISAMNDDDPYSHADLADVIRQTGPAVAATALQICELPHETIAEEDECERQRLATPDGPSASSDDADLTAEEARELAADLGLQLYRAQDAIAFVEECCVIVDREGRQPTTTDVREWLKGARCGGQLAADQAPAASDDELREQLATALWAANGPAAAEDDNVDAVMAVLGRRRDALTRAHIALAEQASKDQAAIARVRAQHTRVAVNDECYECSQRDSPDYSVPWPCPTIAALDGPATTGPADTQEVSDDL